ncbi:MAG: AAA family ATPase [Thermodesulfobacteriaceae bacterium]|nr:AAA family ATPase [Thermodesulfobacteriaceae bacterium]MDW8136503.1 AAA family ATPase [Thermodesulfobacterium sp.]
MKIEITTTLFNKDHIFRVLRVAERNNLPVLLLGEIGTGKTQIFFDYVSSLSNGAPLKVFIRQLHFDTRAEDLLGFLSLPELKQGKVVRIGGIQEAEFILLDEIDKASSSVRNLFLSVLRERAVFDGKEFVPCNWKLLVGTTNKSEFDEDDQAFIDRFVLKARISRVGLSHAKNLLYLKEKKILLEEKEVSPQIFTTALSILEKILPDIYEHLSDRTITYLPSICYSFLSLYDNDPTLALLDTLSYTISEEVAFSLLDKITQNKELIQAKELLKAYLRSQDEETKEFIKSKIFTFLNQNQKNLPSEMYSKIESFLINHLNSI